MANVICIPKLCYVGARNLLPELPGISTLGWRGLIRIKSVLESWLFPTRLCRLSRLPGPPVLGVPERWGAPLGQPKECTHGSVLGPVWESVARVVRTALCASPASDFG